MKYFPPRPLELQIQGKAKEGEATNIYRHQMAKRRLREVPHFPMLNHLINDRTRS